VILSERRSLATVAVAFVMAVAGCGQGSGPASVSPASPVATPTGTSDVGAPATSSVAPTAPAIAPSATPAATPEASPSASLAASPSASAEASGVHTFANLGIAITLPPSWALIDPTNPGPPDLISRWTAVRPNIGELFAYRARTWSIHAGRFGDTAFMAVDTTTFVVTDLRAWAPLTGTTTSTPTSAKAALQAFLAYLRIGSTDGDLSFDEFSTPAGPAAQVYIAEGAVGGGFVYDLLLLPDGLELLLQSGVKARDWTPEVAAMYRTVMSSIQVTDEPTGRPTFRDKALAARFPAAIGTDSLYVFAGSLVFLAEADMARATVLSGLYDQLATAGLPAAGFTGVCVNGGGSAILQAVQVAGMTAAQRTSTLASLTAAGYAESTTVPGSLERRLPTTPATTAYLSITADGLVVEVITADPTRAAAILAAVK
jgi:hypothetical protein